MDDFRQANSARMDPSEAKRVRTVHGFVPRQDPVFDYLMAQACTGRLPVHRAKIPLDLIIPFDASYRPQDLPIGRIVLARVVEDWNRGITPTVRVYPRKERFVLSDDYVYYEAARIAAQACLPCLVLGEADVPGAADIHGPLSLGEVNRALGPI
ncbi:MAG TPA: hypothetical protein VFF76_07995 [Holophagaceae bacterium]|jgi:hypothetical protein|nr:hypothetical protein [Holophagaceae bacterium]